MVFNSGSSFLRNATSVFQSESCGCVLGWGGVQSLVFTLVTISLLFSHVHSAFAKDEYAPGVQGEDNPKKMYEKSIYQRPRQGFVFLREPKAKDVKQKEEEKDQAQFQVHDASMRDTQTTPMDKEPPMLQKTSQDVIARYGDPRGAVAVTPESDAPIPFQGMHAALQIGDEELAFEYARQWARYQEQFKDRIFNIQGLFAKALEAEGYADGEGWTSAPEYERYAPLVEKALKEREEEKEKAEEKIEDPFLLSLPMQHRERAKTPMVFATDYDKQHELEHRDDFRRAFRKVAPVAPDKRVSIVVYVDTTGDRDSLNLARELAGLAQKSKRNGLVELSLVSNEFRDESQLKSFLHRAGLPDIPATYKKREDNVPSILPAVRLSIPSLKKSYDIVGVRRGYFYEELVKVIQGGGRS